MFIQKKIRYFLFILFSIILTACSSKEVPNETLDETSQVILEKDEIIDEEGNLIFPIRQPFTLNPLVNEDATVDNMLKLVFEPLFILDENLKPVPNLAKSYTISEDGLQINITLRNDIYWHDGTSITASDVIYSLDTIRNNPNSIYYNFLDYIQSYSSNGNNITIYYKEPFSFILYNLCFPIIPKHYYTKDTNKDTTESLNTVGSGMFKFSEYNIANSIVLEATTNFKGTPKISTITAIISTDRETDLYSFEQNITNFITSTISDLGKFKSNKEVEIENVVSNNFEFLGFNLKNSLLSNIELRKAIAYLIPKDEIVSNIYLDSGIQASTIVNPKSWLFSSEIISYSYNIEKAKQHLENSNIIFTDENKLTILVNEENNERVETAKLISNRLNQLGIKNEVIKKTFEEYKELLENDDFDIFIGGIDFASYPDYKSFLTSAGLEKGGINYNNIDDEYMNELVDKVYSAVNENDLLIYMEELQQYCNEYLGFVGILFKDYILLSDENVKILKGSRYNFFSNIKDWYITK